MFLVIESLVDSRMLDVCMYVIVVVVIAIFVVVVIKTETKN